MMPLSAWFRAADWRAKPWLLVGKGPSFGRALAADRSQFFTMSLNHAVRELPVDAAHFIDLDAAVDSTDAICKNAEWLILPRFPHVKFQPSDRPLEDLIPETPVLREFADRGRLVWYYHEFEGLTAPLIARDPVPGEPRVRVRYFSSGAAVGILGLAGVTQVRLAGIDGGIHYSTSFRDLHDKTRLANGQPSFDRQFLDIRQAAEEYGMDIGPLTDPVRVYVGCDDSQRVAAKVLEYSIRQFATRPVEVTYLLNLPVPTPKDPANRPRTGFSFARFLIPQLAGFRGRGIYLDADMLVFTDIADLWDTPLDDKFVQCARVDTPPGQWRDNAGFKAGRQLSVMLLDCGELTWDIDRIVAGLDEGRYDYLQLMGDLCIVPPDKVGESLSPTWNSLEHFAAGETRLLHLTDMTIQPWRAKGNPLGHLWREFYRAAVADGAVPPELVDEGVAKGHLLPELAQDLSLAPGRRPAGVRVSVRHDGPTGARSRGDWLTAVAARAENEFLREAAAHAEAAAKALKDGGIASLVDLNGRLGLKEHELAQKGLAIAWKDELLAQKDAQLGTKDAALAEKDAVIAHKDAVIAHKDAVIGNKDEQIAVLNAHLRTVLREVAGMQGSVTWKAGRAMTLPLRGVRKVLRKFKAA